MDFKFLLLAVIVRTLKKFGSLVAGVVGRMFHFVFGDDELDAYLQNSLVVMLRGIAKLRKAQHREVFE